MASASPPMPRGRRRKVKTKVKGMNCIDGKYLKVGQKMSDGPLKKVSLYMALWARARARARGAARVDEGSWVGEEGGVALVWVGRACLLVQG